MPTGLKNLLLDGHLKRQFQGPPAPPVYQPQSLAGRQEDPQSSFLREMSPMLIAGLADLLSTEGMMRSGYVEDNPVLKRLKIGGSVAPALGLGSLLQAFLYHQIGKKNKTIGDALSAQQTSTSGTLAGQNFSLIGKDPYGRDDRLSVWNQNAR